MQPADAGAGCLLGQLSKKQILENSSCHDEQGYSIIINCDKMGNMMWGKNDICSVSMCHVAFCRPPVSQGERIQGTIDGKLVACTCCTYSLAAAS